ncbi:MAG: hypothetical protein EZS28_009375 [Streblomastix strix]|uniref:B30.2/SPRY domain-containing protein n=1 Tax=Streblomastix strix TaxID=222440 RepID=A0A5J4WJQ2_9EUKA|nr:MAG: hypothetical protein EZS28_009375 [Streblomastix strix]
MSVPTEFNVIGGLPGLGPDIMLEVLSECRLISNAVQFVGVNKKTLNIKNHARFFKIIETLNYPISIINNDPSEIVFSDIDGIMKKISKKNDEWITVSLTQILENGIWQMEAEFNNSSDWAVVGIVRDTYNIFAGAHPCLNPHHNLMVSYGMRDFRQFMGNGKIYYKGIGTLGNIAYKDNQKIKAEFDSEKGTVIFSVDGVQQPVYVRGINEKVRFFIYIYKSQTSCTIRSLKKLIAPTTKHVANEIAVQW